MVTAQPMAATDRRVQWTLPLPTPVILTPEDIEDEDPFWAWTSERLDERA